MANQQQNTNKADVQGTRLNQMPAPGATDTEFSAEEAATVFENNQNQASQNAMQNQNQQ